MGRQSASFTVMAGPAGVARTAPSSTSDSLMVSLEQGRVP